MDPLAWDVSQVIAHFRDLGFPENVLDMLSENDIDGSVLLEDVDDEALKDSLSLASFGIRRKILKEIAKLKGPTVEIKKSKSEVKEEVSKPEFASSIKQMVANSLSKNKATEEIDLEIEEWVPLDEPLTLNLPSFIPIKKSRKAKKVQLAALDHF